MTRRSAILILLLGACAHDVSLGGPNTLVRVEGEPAGVHCLQGGVAIHTGLDDNGDTFLDDDEIVSTQYVCNGESIVQCQGGKVLTGTINVRDTGELGQLDDTNCIDGDLLITGTDITAIPKLPKLEIVTGDIVIAGNAQLESLAGLEAVKEVGRSYLLQGNAALTDVSALGKLQRVGSISINANDALLDLAGLEPFVDISTTISITNNASLESLTGLDNLTNAGRVITIRNNRALSSVAALDQLRAAITVEISGNIVLPAISLTSLEKLDGRLVINTNPALTGVELPSLTTVGDFVRFDGNGALTTISAPSLLTAGAMFITNDPSLTAVHAPSLLFVTGDFNLGVVAKLATAGFGELTSIGGNLSVLGANQLADLSGFARLNSVGNTLLISASGVTGFGMTSLAVVSGNLQITNNARLTSFTGLPAMGEVGQDLTITGNPMLPVGVSQAFRDRITVRGKTTITP
jgi:hypothetical protein